MNQPGSIGGNPQPRVLRPESTSRAYSWIRVRALSPKTARRR